MTTLLRSVTVANAAWREAARFRHPDIDVDHVFLALIAAGGPAAALLGRHGVTLASARAAVLAARRADAEHVGLDAGVLDVDPLPVSDLHTGAAGQVPMNERAQAVFDALPRTSSELHLLAALVEEPSGIVRVVVTRCGLDPDALVREAREASPTGDSEPRSCPADPAFAPHVRGTHVTAIRMAHMISAPPEVAHRAATDPDLVRIWLNVGDEATVLDSTIRYSVVKKGKTFTDVFVPVVDETYGDGRRIVWQMRFETPGLRWDGTDGGYHALLLRAVPGGTLVEYTYAYRTFGALRHVVRPLARLGALGGMPHRLQNLAFVTADLDAPTP